MEPIDFDDVVACLQRIAEEEALARSAHSRETGDRHSEMAMLYRARLDLLKTQRV